MSESQNLGEPRDPTPESSEPIEIEIEHIDTEEGVEEPKPIEPPKPPAPAMPPVAPMPPPPSPPRPPAATDPLSGEEDEAKYGEEVQKRIQQLRYLGHTERRAKEAVVRERDTAIARTNELIQEIDRLRGQVAQSDTVALDQALDKVAARIEAAKSAYAKAHEAGNIDEILKAQEALGSSIAERDRLSMYKRSATPSSVAPASATAAAPAPANVAPSAQEIDPSTARWLERNPWFFTPGYEEMHNFALSIHHRLRAQGITPGSPREQEYFEVIDKNLKERFPEQFGSGSAPAPVQAQSPPGQNGRTETRTPSRPVTPSAGTRTTAGAKAPVKVRLNPHQVQLCRRMGIKEEDYARELIKQQQAS